MNTKQEMDITQAFEYATHFLQWVELNYVKVDENDTMPPFNSMSFVTKEDFNKHSDVIDDMLGDELIESYYTEDLWDLFCQYIEQQNSLPLHTD